MPAFQPARANRPEVKQEMAGFQIKYSVNDSPVPGIGRGVFTEEFIPRGKLIWKYVRGVNVRTYSNLAAVQSRLSELSEEEQRFFMHHVYHVGGMINELLDDAKMWNHSDTPNTGYGPEGSDYFSSYATRDIQAGEELFDDYGRYEYPEYFRQLAKQYAVGQDFFTARIVKPAPPQE